MSDSYCCLDAIIAFFVLNLRIDGLAKSDHKEKNQIHHEGHEKQNTEIIEYFIILAYFPW